MVGQAIENRGCGRGQPMIKYLEEDGRQTTDEPRTPLRPCLDATGLAQRHPSPRLLACISWTGSGRGWKTVGVGGAERLGPWSSDNLQATL